MMTFEGLKRVWRGVRHRSGAVWEAVRFWADSLPEDSFHPDHPQKARAHVLWDVVSEAASVGECNREYFLYGIDRRGVDRRHFPPKPLLMSIVTRQIQSRGAQGQAALLRDKLAFERELRAGGFSTPRILGVVRAGEVEVEGAGAGPPSVYVREASVPRSLFFKPLKGSGGRGAYRILTRDDDVLVNGRAHSWEDLDGLFQADYIVQETVDQHPDLDRIYPLSLNTLRIITALKEDSCEVIGCFLRLGNAGAVTDNISGSGLGVGVDLESGMLSPFGLYRSGREGRPEAHPQTGFRFDGFNVPFFAESRELVTALHQHLGGLVTVGWDVAITPTGPTVVEGNTYWMPRFHIATDPGFLHRYARVVEPWLTGKDSAWATVALAGGPGHG